MNYAPISRDAFGRSKDLLDQADNADHLLENKRQAQAAIESATPEQLDLVLEVLQRTSKITGQVAAIAS